MLVVFLTVLGFTFAGPEPGTSCLEALHRLRTEHGLEVASAEGVGDTLVYLLVDKSRHKSAEVGCALPE